MRVAMPDASTVFFIEVMFFAYRTSLFIASDGVTSEIVHG